MLSKSETQLLKAKIESLTHENFELKAKIKLLEKDIASNSRQDDPTDSSDYNSHFNLRIHSQQMEYIVKPNSDYRYSTLQKLKQRIDKLQKQHLVKTEIINDLIEKQIRYKDEIQTLIYNKDSLKEQVDSLKESIKIQLFEVEKNLARTNVSQFPIEKQIITSFNHYLSPNQIYIDPTEQNFNEEIASKGEKLLDSQCCDFQIPRNFHLSQVQQRQVCQLEEIQEDEIDGMLQKQIDNYNSCDFNSNCSEPPVASFENLNTSIVRVEVPERANEQSSINTSMINIEI